MSKIPWYVLFTSLMVLCIGIAIYFYFMKDPSKDRSCAYGCDSAHIISPWINGPGCLSVIETKLDPSIPKPTQIPYLSNFKFVGSIPPLPPFCSPAWYAFRYVRNSDGAYGPLSNWSGSEGPNGSEGPGGTSPLDSTPMAIYACATELPCIPGADGKSSCSAARIPVGKSTSSFNAPTLALTKPLDFDIKYMTPEGYTLNLHRQVGYIDQNKKIVDFDPDAEGDIVGSFSVYNKPVEGIYAFVQDSIFPPKSNPVGQTTCCN